ncbi:hypothetical protein ACFSC6_08590 [Rufibacter sediminis]|uniref:PH domain-containing protein n=1 Tax=Rufibacter sediminis TaxID=2762756 RepID=A0ABR6VXW2_9BACT|nr:hypothetical protein [Rufibacter sediminis]MBC3542052.1 hypothetical protein [Rufibacter sediminis]
MKSYQVKYILPNKALLLSFGCLLPFAAFGIYLELEMQTGKTIASIPFLIGTGLAFYFIMFYVDGEKLIKISDDLIIADGTTIKIKSISSIKLKDDSPEFIYLKVFTNSGQNLSIGTRTSDKGELLKLYEELKKAIQKHDKESHQQIMENKLIYDTPWGKLIGVAAITLMVFILHNQFFTNNPAKSLGGFFTALNCGTFLLYRIFRKNNNR